MLMGAKSHALVIPLAGLTICQESGLVLSNERQLFDTVANNAIVRS